MFDIGKVIRRRSLDEQYGGQQQGGISTPSQYPLVILFTGESGQGFEYSDGWENDGTFRYTGEGQVGDMTFRAGNKAIRDHAVKGKDLHMFEDAGRAHVRYLGQMVCAGYEEVPGVPDRDGHLRTAIVFRLLPAENADAVPVETPATSGSQGIHTPSWYWTRLCTRTRLTG